MHGGVSKEDAGNARVTSAPRTQSGRAWDERVLAELRTAAADATVHAVQGVCTDCTVSTSAVISPHSCLWQGPPLPNGDTFHKLHTQAKFLSEVWSLHRGNYREADHCHHSAVSECTAFLHSPLTAQTKRKGHTIQGMAGDELGGPLSPSPQGWIYRTSPPAGPHLCLQCDWSMWGNCSSQLC